jgi:hypothetical protein
MRYVPVIALAAAIAACASDSQRQAAMIQCETVGVTRSDPYFETCTRSYLLQANQANLDTSYKRALNPTYEKRGLSHQWHGF